MILSDLKTYWQKAATNNLLIQHTESSKHYCSFTAEEALSALKNIKSPALCLELPEMNLSDGLSDNVRLVSKGAILVLKHAKQGDNAMISQAFLDTEVIVLQLESKMLNDRRRANESDRLSPEKDMKHLDLNKVRWVDVGPVFDSMYGWRLEFEFNGPVNLALDESKWLPGTEVAWTNQ
jgi:hypothetical protein